MDTKLLNTNELKTAAKLIQKGELVAFPTDTVYGLGADATNEEAVKNIFKAKGRPANRPINVLVGKHEAIQQYAKDVPAEAIQLVEAFWPGPFTIILNTAGNLASAITAGKKTVGMRMPDLKLARDFIDMCGVPLATPSANSSGRPSPTRAEHVMDDLAGKIAAVIDGGLTAYGIESTILDYSNPKQPILLRPGNVSKENIEAVISRKVFLPSDLVDQEQMETIKHYEPLLPVYIVKTDWAEVIESFQKQNEKVGILASQEIIHRFKNDAVSTFSLGIKSDIDSANKNLFQGLRALERSKATVILAEVYPNEGTGLSFMNRLGQAANKKTI